MDVSDKDCSELELQVMIDKLSNSVCEIRWRAFQNILSKLSYGLLNLENLIDSHSGRLCENLLKWFSTESYPIPKPKIVLTLFLKIINETVNGVRIMINLNTRHILQVWVTSYIEDNEVTKLVRDICSELVTTISKEITDKSKVFMYGEQGLLLQDRVDDDITSTDTSITTSTNTFSSPARFLTNTRDEYIKSQIPTHLLEPASSSSDTSISQNTRRNENGLYSPISRSYLKRKVTFSQISEGQEYDDTNNTAVDENDIITEMFPFSPLISEWHTLAKTDRDLLDNIESRLKSSEVSDVRSALQELSSFVLEDFPPEVLLQRPDIVFLTHDILMLQHDVSLRFSSASCLHRLIQKLQDRLEFCSNPGFVGRKNCDIIFTDSLSNHQGGSLQDYQGDNDGEESYSDVINAQKLKKKQLFVHELCIITLNNAAVSLCLDKSENTNAHYVLGLITVSSRLFCATLKLLKSLGFPDGFDRRIKQNCKIAHQILEVLEEISTGLSKSLCVHKNLCSKYSTSEDLSYHRLAYLIALKTTVHFREVISNDCCKQKLDKVLQDSILDSTLYLTNENLHKRITNLYLENNSDTKEMQLFKEAKEVMKSMVQCIKLFKNVDALSPKQILRACNAALISYPWHESISIVSTTVKLCRKLRFRSQDELEKQLLSTTLTKILSHKDLRIRTSGYLELHGLVQDILGIGRALDLEGTKKHELEFLLDCPDVFKQILQYGCTAEGKECDHIRQAAQEIIVYFLKGKPVLGEFLWDVFVEKVFKPNCVILNCLIESDDLSNSNRGNEDISFYLNKKLLTLFCPPVSDTSMDSNTDMTLNEKVELLRSNMRLMFHQHSTVRFRANSNLKAMLSQEANSYDKLPRFSDIIKTDLSETTKFVFNPDLNKLVNLEEDLTYLPSLLLRNSTSDEENLSTLKKILAILSRATFDEELTTDNDMQLRRAALSRLEIILQDENVRNSFLSQNCNGLNLLLYILYKCLSETNYDYVPEQYIPSIIKCFSILAFRNYLFREILSNKEEFLFSCIRCLYMFHKNNEVIADIHNLVIAVVFVGYIEYKTGENSLTEKSNGVYVPEILRKRFFIPFQHFEADNSNNIIKDSDENYEISPLLSTFWNLAWFGSANELSGWSTTRVNRNTNKNIASREVQMIPEKLQLSDRNLLIVQVSDPICCLRTCLDTIKNAKTHSDFHHQLQVFLSTSLLTSCSSTVKSILNLDWKPFERFFTNKPSTVSDEVLFVSMLGFLHCLMLHFSQVLEREEILKENNFKKFILESVLQEGATNLSHFLIKTSHDILNQDARKEQQHALTVKGNEKAGLFLLYLIDFYNSSGNLNARNEFYVNLVDAFMQASKNSLPHCHWPMMVIEKIFSLSPGLTESLGISKASKMISKCIDSFSKPSNVNQKRIRLFLASSITLNASKVIQAVLSCYSEDNEKTKRIMLETCSGNKRLSWMKDSLWQSRNTLVRTVGLGIGNVLSQSSSGAEFLLGSGNCNEEFWFKVASVFLDRTECPNARSESANIMANLLKCSLESKKSWFGPSFVEPVSKLLIDGEGALYHFLDEIHLDRELVDIFQSFARQHFSMTQQQSETFNDASYSDFALQRTENSTTNDYTNPDTSVTASPTNTSNFICVEISATPVLLTSIHKLLQVILTMEAEASTDVVNDLHESSLFPYFDSAVIPALAGLVFDASDPRTDKAIQKTLSGNSDDNCHDVYMNMTLEFVKLMVLCLKRQRHKKSNSSEERAKTKDIAQFLYENDYTCQSMLVNTIYYFYKKSSIKDLQKIQLISELSLQISTFLRLSAPNKIFSDGNMDESKHVFFLCKYLTGVLEMSNFVLAFDDQQIGDNTKIVKSLPLLNILAFIANYFQNINMGNSYTTAQINISRQKNQKLTEKLCNTILRVHTKIKGSAGSIYDVRQKKLIIAAIYMSLQEIFSINSETKMMILYEETTSSNTMHYSFLQDIIEKLGLLADRFKSALNSRKPTAVWVQSWWTELQLMLSLLNNFCYENSKGKEDLITRGIMEKLLNIWTILIKLPNPSSPPIDLVKTSITAILKLLTSMTCDCEQAKSALVKNSIISSEGTVSKENPQQNLLHHFLNICKSDWRDPSIKLFQSMEGQTYFTRVAYPLAFRIIMSSLTNKDCRLNILRNKFPDNCLQFIEYERDQKQGNQKRKTATEVILSSTRRNFAILWFDFLLSLTTFPDGQSWLGTKGELLDILIDIASTDLYPDTPKIDLTGLAALAILRNVSFNSSNRARLILSKKFLRLLADKVLITKQDHSSKSEDNKQAENIALSAVWALSANNHKAKVAFSDAGITKLLTDEYNRREVESDQRITQGNKKHKVRFVDENENIEFQQSTSMLKEVLCILNP